MRRRILKTTFKRIEAQPSQLYTFQRLHLNIWTNSQEAAWIQDHDVMKGAEDMPSEAELNGCLVGEAWTLQARAT